MLNPLTYVPRAFFSAKRFIEMLREVRTHERRILAGRDLIASELRHNAAVLAEMKRPPLDWKALRDRIALDRWRQYGGELSILPKRHPELSADVIVAYEELQRAQKAPLAAPTDERGPLRLGRAASSRNL